MSSGKMFEGDPYQASSVRVGTKREVTESWVETEKRYLDVLRGDLATAERQRMIRQAAEIRKELRWRETQLREVQASLERQSDGE